MEGLSVRFFPFREVRRNWLTGDHQPVGKSLEKLRVFLDAEARRTAGRWDQTDRAGAGKAVGTRAP